MDADLKPMAKPDAVIGPGLEYAACFQIRPGESAAPSDAWPSLFDHLPIGVFVLTNGLFSFFNPALLHFFGYASLSDLLGKPISDFTHPEDRKIFEYCHLSEKCFRADQEKLIRIVRKDGQVSWAHVAFKTIFNDIDTFQIGCLVDMTTAKKTMDDLRTSLHKFMTIFDEIDDVLAEVDLDGKILSVNNNANLKIWGVPMEQTIGTSYRCYVDEKNEQIVKQAYRKIYQTGIPGRVTYEIRRIDGGKRHVEDYACLLYDDREKPAGFRVVSRDVTERKEAEMELAAHRMRLEAIFTSVKDAIITVDTQLRVIEANKSTETICGLAVSTLVGQRLPECLSECKKTCLDVISLTLENKVTVQDYRIDCGHDKRQQVVNMTCSPLLNSEGAFMGAVLVIRDVTLLRNMEKELRERNQFQNIVGQSRKMKSVYSLVESLADMGTTVLITGESGTGKELVARALHYGSQRALKPFIAVNCSALTESLLESELFGHIKGAFTGATRDREGRFQAAQGGTILLDEIGDLSPIIQLKLLRVLQEKVFERVGETAPRKADVRIITCTNRDLKEKVRRGELREDLYYRLKVVEITLPPLRDREEDIPLLVDHFRKYFNEKFNKHVETISQHVLGSFMDYPWPGNVRELEHVMEHAFVLCRRHEISMDDLSLEFKEELRTAHLTTKPVPENYFKESEVVLNALIKTRGNKAKAARLLGISRQTIYRKIYQYQLPGRP